MFEGIQVTGMPDVVLSRGKSSIEGDKFLGRAGTGRIPAALNLRSSQWMKI